MLILTRKTDEQILIGENITITLVRVRGNSVRIGIDAPRDVRVIRGELQSFDSKSDRGAKLESTDPQPPKADPQTKVISGRVKIPDRRVPSARASMDVSTQASMDVSAQASANDALDQATTPYRLVGRIQPAATAAKRDRPPLAGFVSAT